MKALNDLHLRLSAGQPAPARFCRREDIEPLLSSFGISRVAEQTGLDSIGVPVWSAIRPISRGLSVATGKGVSDEAAWLSAVFESLEQAFAERAPDLCAMVETPARMAERGHRTIPLARQPRCAASRIHPGVQVAWVRGQSLVTGEEVFAPYNLVGMDMTEAAPWDPDLFLMASNGLGAGGNIAGAVLQGLRELVEDDAFLAAQYFPTQRRNPGDSMTFDCASNHPLPEIVRIVESTGLEVRFMSPQTGLELPTVVAALLPSPGGTHPLFSGVACRDRFEDAALAALLEAIQTRLTFVAGSREDLDLDEYKATSMQEASGFQRAAFTYRTDGVHSDAGGELSRLIEALKVQGIEGIYVFPLGRVPDKFEVVRVLADDLMSIEHIPGTVMPEFASRRLLNGMLAR
ncbi:YcaO-like family protein [Rhodobacteraceae bacterium]|nr:YcaO-like family protein [Paracoccaceae bacterium]